MEYFLHKNKEHGNEYQTQHYQENKDEINRKKRGKLVCTCGVACVNHQKQRHLRSNKHQDWLKKHNEE